jgi:hypothetical protein
MKNVIMIEEGVFLNLKSVSLFKISKEYIDLMLVDESSVMIKTDPNVNAFLGPRYTVPINEYKRIEREINEFINHKI